MKSTSHNKFNNYWSVAKVPAGYRTCPLFHGTEHGDLIRSTINEYWCEQRYGTCFKDDFQVLKGVQELLPPGGIELQKLDVYSAGAASVVKRAMPKNKGIRMPKALKKTIELRRSFKALSKKKGIDCVVHSLMHHQKSFSQIRFEFTFVVSYHSRLTLIEMVQHALALIADLQEAESFLPPKWTVYNIPLAPIIEDMLRLKQTVVS